VLETFYGMSLINSSAHNKRGKIEGFYYKVTSNVEFKSLPKIY
jgi:hypothetical protein